MNPNHFEVKILAEHPTNKARVLKIDTPHGSFTTPAFMPVGTRAAVNTMTVQDLHQAKADIILGGNTYHMLVSPGMEIIQNAGGMHKFMAWDGAMLIDSGGFQVFSLSRNNKLCKIKEDGAHFKHPDSGAKILLSPETSIETQKILGADIVMAFDECTPDTADKDYVVRAMKRTHRWLLQSLNYHKEQPQSKYGFHQAFFGIAQGAFFEDLRLESTQFVVEMDTDGIAIGGGTVGYDMEKTVEIMKWLEPILPKQKPRYTMGVGAHPNDLLQVVEQGVDMFDCVAPTRNARHGSLYSGKIVRKNGWIAFESEYPQGKINLNNAQFTKDNRPVMEDCPCFTCRNHSRSYLRFLLKSDAVLYNNLASMHNVQVMLDICKAMQACMLELL
ncbi:MAG: tRNA guanosine(34) transglycosylase Tgt [Bacteroidia bacterium]